MTRMCIGASVTGALTVREVESRRARLRASDRSCALSPVRRGVCEDEVGHAAVDERGGGARQVARLQAHRAVQREPGGGDVVLRAGALTAKGMASDPRRNPSADRRFAEGFSLAPLAGVGSFWAECGPSRARFRARFGALRAPADPEPGHALFARTTRSTSQSRTCSKDTSWSTDFL